MPTYYSEDGAYFEPPRWVYTALVSIISLLVFGLFLTDCYGGHRETLRGQVRGREYTKAATTGKNRTPASWTLYMSTAEGYTWVECAPEVYYRVPDFDSLTLYRRRTRWSNYTFSTHF
jgi:hypothetical protein